MSSMSAKVGSMVAAALLFVAGGCQTGSADVEAQAADPAATHVDIFPVAVEDEIGGKPAKLKLTGMATRTKFGVAFYKIAGYCCETTAPADVDALAAADVPKRLVLVMERDISRSTLESSFEKSFELNDPDGKFAAESRQMLDYMSRDDLKQGQRVEITHVPQTGISCRVADREPQAVNNPAFARVVWNIYMGPYPVSDEVREGLGMRLAKAK